MSNLLPTVTSRRYRNVSLSVDTRGKQWTKAGSCRFRKTLDGTVCQTAYTFLLLEKYAEDTRVIPPPPLSHLLQFMMMSSGWILFFSMPCFGCSPLPRKRPGGSSLKLPMRSLWWSSRQYPNLSRIFWLASFNACKMNNEKSETLWLHSQPLEIEYYRPASPPCSCFFWPPPLLYAWYESLQSHICQGLESATFLHQSFPCETQNIEY